MPLAIYLGEGRAYTRLAGSESDWRMLWYKLSKAFHRLLSISISKLTHIVLQVLLIKDSMDSSQLSAFCLSHKTSWTHNQCLIKTGFFYCFQKTQGRKNS